MNSVTTDGLFAALRDAQHAVLVGAGTFAAVMFWKSRGGAGAGTGPTDRQLTGAQLMDPVFFEFAQFTVPTQDQGRLRQLGERLLATGQRLTVTGHTDKIGTDANNLQLGQRRANAVARAVSSGAGSMDQLTVDSAGERLCPTGGRERNCRKVTFRAAR